MTEYVTIQDRAAIFQGDTLDGMAFQLFDINDEVIIPAGLCCQMRGHNGQILHTFPTSISPEGICRVGGLTSEETANIFPGSHNYSVRVTLRSGRKRTYIKGAIPIKKVPSRC